MLASMIEYSAKTFRIMLALTCAILFFRAFIFEPGRVSGHSMENTFIDGEVFLVDKHTLLFREPRRGDVVQVYNPSEKKLIIKRVIGLPGEQLQISDGHVSIVGSDAQAHLLNEPYLAPGTYTESLSHDATLYPVIPANEYFLMGDHREVSIDSRGHGSIHRSEITGLVVTIPFFNK